MLNAAVILGPALRYFSLCHDTTCCTTPLRTPCPAPPVQIPLRGRLVILFKAKLPVLVLDQAMGPDCFQIMWGDQVRPLVRGGGRFGCRHVLMSQSSCGNVLPVPVGEGPQQRRG